MVPYMHFYLLCVLSRFSHVRLFATLWTVACQATVSMGFSRQEYWSGLPCPPPGYLPDPGIEPKSFMYPYWQEGSLPLAPPGKPLTYYNSVQLQLYVRVDYNSPGG